jgi:hypothetical protein
VSDARLHVFGIRHHGPGSAFSLERALDAADPQLVLIEGPPEADEMLRFANSAAMRPPVALLAHAADDPSLATFYPFAEYSPEWRAVLWALKRKRTVRFFDLPMAYRLAAYKAEREAIEDPAPENAEAEETKALEAEVSPFRRDPLSALAEAAGYEDSEAWWNALIEQGAHAPALFRAIEEGMTQLRDAADHEGPRSAEEGVWEPRREAHMRLEAARALKETDGAVAAVVGAWHVPALRARVPLKEDQAQLRGLAKVKVAVTWVPWTEPRLAAASGYRAGVVSPAWYSALWRELSALPEGGAIDRRGLVARWLTRAAHLLRDAGQHAATASVIETARLAESIAAVRGLAMPGLPEMRDASLAALCGGEPAPLRLIEERLIVGTAVGEIDEAVPQMPLQADLAYWQRKLRLKPEATEQEISLDLRSDAGLDKSQLLHRLLLINVSWGRLLDPGGRGTFRERWMIAWSPELSVRLAEALVWGATVEQAASGAAAERARKATSLSDLAELVSKCLLAGLGQAARHAIDTLQAAASTGGVEPMVEAMPPLAQVLRYGTARELPEEELSLLVLSLSERVCIGVPYACRNLDAAQADAMRKRLDSFAKAVPLVENENLAADWTATLGKLADDDAVAPLVAGFAVRQLYDQAKIDAAEAARRLSLALSPAQPPGFAGAWLDGFLSAAGQVLLHDEALFGAVDSFMMSLGDEEFTALLPMFRRTFAGFDRMERRHLLARSRLGSVAPVARQSSEEDAPGFAGALPLLRTILGLDREGGS